MATSITFHAIPPRSTQGARVPVDFRSQIRQRLDRMKLTKYWLAEQLNGKVTRSAIYNYLREKSPSEIGADKLEAMLNVLEETERQQKQR
jgi:hypothetical protein